MHLPWPNSGDYGMNLLRLGIISLLGPIVWLCLRAKTVSIPPHLFTIICKRSAVYSSGILEGVFAYLTLLQQPIREKETVALFYLLAAAAVIECALSLAGFYCPQYLPFPLNSLAEKYSGYAPGIFQQVNVTASFLATGLAALLGTVILQPSVVASLQHKGSNQQR
ncbi:hypothetical protein RZR10_00880 [Enterobacter asburiae]|uniref:pilin glycosylation ligase domain-containing protein n=1 Tax=Enterobacter asburiae TaxID=61645 RepID=UPI002005FDBC|nr:pilin glycosylation ligase domain-containing protein [Enterobacter asburiae]MCK6678649.1 hypothetical protein [Enterobacter asburiae]MDV1792307.1 hypothetical protein [Enterobacter asburiae]WNS34121.1 hypothetical protein RQP58_05180 [Enterobacter asburiae]HCR2152641.1 hypothetical protein [Enterobacter asburiae]